MKMKKLLAVTFSMIMGLLILSSCSQSGNPGSSQNGQNQTASHDPAAPGNNTVNNTAIVSEPRTIIVGTVGANAPYSLIDDKGNWTGVEAELWAEVEERTDWKIEVKQVSDLASLFGELDTGRINVAANCFAITESRLENYIASAPLYADAQVIIVQPESEYMTLEDLRGVTIGVTAGQAAQNTVEKLAPDYDWEVVTYEDTNAGFQDCS